MTYKDIFLTILLIPCTSVAYEASIEIRIKELQEIRLKKLLELSDLGKMIAEKEEFLRSLTESVVPIFAVLKEKKISYLERKKGRELSIEEREKLDQNGKNCTSLFLDKLLHYKEEKTTMEELLIKELYDQECLDSVASFESIKFIFLRGVFERELLAKLVGKYALCVEELMQLNTDLDALDDRETYEIW